MAPTIRPYDLGPGRAQAFAYHDGRTAHLAVQPHLGEDARRSREIEAHHYDLRPPRSGRKWCLSPTSFEDIDELSVRAQQRHVERMEPLWVGHVKELWLFYRDFTSTVFWSELEPETVMAILRLLMDRGEIPPDGDWS